MSKKIEDGLTPQQRYTRSKIVAASLQLNRTTDADILAFLDAHAGGNRQGFIKKILREEIARRAE